MALLTRQQIEKLAQIIKDHTTLFIWQVCGKDQVSQAEIDRLKAKGLLPVDVTASSIKYAYVLGRLESTLKEGEYKNLSWKELMELATGRYTAIDHMQISAAEMMAANRIRGIGNDIQNGLYDELGQATQKTISEAAVRGEIKDVVRTGVGLSKTYAQVAKDLVERMKEPERNWVRVASNELASAQQRGVANAILQGVDVYERAEGEDSLVAVQHGGEACPDCKRLYEDSRGHPKVFKLKELMANEGSNYNRPWRQNAGPVVPPLHPHCYGRLIYVPPGWGWDDKGTFTLLDPKAAYPGIYP